MFCPAFADFGNWCDPVMFSCVKHSQATIDSSRNSLSLSWNHWFTGFTGEVFAPVHQSGTSLHLQTQRAAPKSQASIFPHKLGTRNVSISCFSWAFAVYDHFILVRFKFLTNKNWLYNYYDTTTIRYQRTLASHLTRVRLKPGKLHNCFFYLFFYKSKGFFHLFLLPLVDPFHKAAASPHFNLAQVLGWVWPVQWGRRDHQMHASGPFFLKQHFFEACDQTVRGHSDRLTAAQVEQVFQQKHRGEPL